MVCLMFSCSTGTERTIAAGITCMVDNFTGGLAGCMHRQVCGIWWVLITDVFAGYGAVVLSCVGEMPPGVAVELRYILSTHTQLSTPSHVMPQPH